MSPLSVKRIKFDYWAMEWTQVIADRKIAKTEENNNI